MNIIKKQVLVLFVILCAFCNASFAYEEIEDLNWQAVYDDMQKNPEKHPIVVNSYNEPNMAKKRSNSFFRASFFINRYEIIQNLNDILDIKDTLHYETLAEIMQTKKGDDVESAIAMAYYAGISALLSITFDMTDQEKITYKLDYVLSLHAMIHNMETSRSNWTSLWQFIWENNSETKEIIKLMQDLDNILEREEQVEKGQIAKLIKSLKDIKDISSDMIPKMNDVLGYTNAHLTGIEMLEHFLEQKDTIVEKIALSFYLGTINSFYSVDKDLAEEEPDKKTYASYAYYQEAFKLQAQLLNEL